MMLSFCTGSIVRFCIPSLVVVLTAAASVLGVTVSNGDVSASPNVILIFADDLGYGDVGCFNADCPFQTPRLDQMAAEGARLTNFYVPTPYCAPSRGTILTGRYPFRHTVVGNPAPDAGASNFGLPQSEVTIAELLRVQGYATAAYGKWHLGHRPQWLPRTQGFQDYFGILYSNDMFPVQLVHNEEVVEYPVVQARLTQSYTAMALSFIEANRESPFFLYLPLAMPHKPLAASDNFYTPDTLDDLYADVIAELDWSVGQILDKLSELELDEDTLVVFTSDNGPWFGGSTGGLRGMKGKTWEGGLRVPMIARMPGVIPHGIVNENVAATIDILPTICDLTGAEIPNDRTIDGHDLMPLLQDGQHPAIHSEIYGMHGGRLAFIRSGKWKLHVTRPASPFFDRMTDDEKRNWVDPRRPDGVAILAPYEQATPDQHPGLTSGDAPQEMMLFDLERDPGEQTNVAAAHPEIVKKLFATFERMNSEVPDYKPAPKDYLFKQTGGGPAPLMHLIGGALEYDNIPDFQKNMLDPAIAR